MQHYFIDKEHSQSDFFDFKDTVLGFDLVFNSCDSVFSKNKIDDGTRALLETISAKESLSGHGLDLGCGLGALSIPLIKKFGVYLDMVDVNKTAVKLSHDNLIRNNVQHSAKVYFSDGFSEVSDTFDFIVSNPPIKVGKKVLFSMMEGTYSHLISGGKILIVIRKDLGMESLKKFLTTIYNNCEIIGRDKGYYVLKCIKQ